MKKILILPLILFLLIISIFYYRFTINKAPDEIPSALINKEAPIFETYSLLNNNLINSKDIFNNKITLVNFFATWCIPCREEHKNLIRLSKEKDISIIGINFKDDQKLAIQWLKELGNPYSIVGIDQNGNIGLDWGVYGLPETFIINSDHIIKYRKAGPITNDVYDDFYKKVINYSR